MYTDFATYFKMIVKYFNFSVNNSYANFKSVKIISSCAQKLPGSF